MPKTDRQTEFILIKPNFGCVGRDTWFFTNWLTHFTDNKHSPIVIPRSESRTPDVASRRRSHNRYAKIALPPPKNVWSKCVQMESMNDLKNKLFWLFLLLLYTQYYKKKIVAEDVGRRNANRTASELFLYPANGFSSKHCIKMQDNSTKVLQFKINQHPRY